jgi:asparagine synthetase B (glutamine-hydrolysing)
MPGIFGSVGETSQAAAQALARALQHGPGFEVQVIERFSCFHGGVARRKQSVDALSPHVSRENGYAVLFQGRLFPNNSLGARRLTDDEVFDEVLEAYLAHGNDFSSRLKGDFAVAVWDEKNQILVAAVDAFAEYPLYYMSDGEELSFAQECKALWNVCKRPFQEDKTAIAEFLYFGYPLLDRTFSRSTKFLMQGKTLCWERGDIRISQGAPWPFPGERSRFNLSEAADAMQDAIRMAVMRRVDTSDRILLPLSGGLDSRFIAAALREQSHVPACITLGSPKCEEASIARKVANTLHFPHQSVEFAPDTLPEISKLLTYFNDGMNCIQGGLSIDFCGEPTREATVCLNGFFGDRLAGAAYNNAVKGLGRDISRINHNREQVTAFCLKKHRSMPSFQTLEDYGFSQGQYFDAIRQDVEKALQPAWDADCCDVEAAEFFDMTQRQTRFIARGGGIVRYFCDTRCPLADYDLLKLVLSLPPELRMDYTLYLETFRRFAPDLARIRYYGTRIPVTPFWWSGPMQKFRTLTHYSKYAMKRAFEIGSRGRFNMRLPRYYAYFDAWLRENLRDWTLRELDEGARAFGWNLKQIHKLYSGHMKGKHNCSWPILAAITLRQWLPMFTESKPFTPIDIDAALDSARRGQGARRG